MKIDVLGTKYTVNRVAYGKDKYMTEKNYCGYCDGSNKKIVILDYSTLPEFRNESESVIKSKETETLRHELIHAFLNESGLEWNSIYSGAWAKNEEMVDWFALQMPKLVKAFNICGCI